MNSEKVKEIKKGLEDNATREHYNSLWYMDDCKCITVFYADILTLINELESENKRLNKAINNVQKGFDNGEFISKDCQTKTLKQFVEKLKEKALSHCRTINCYELTFIETTVDELLKEYDNDTI